jgi:hypothetical protein
MTLTLSARKRQPARLLDNIYGRRLLRTLHTLTVPGGPDGECWDWVGAYSTRNGTPTYPAASVRINGRRVVVRPYRLAFEAAFGPVPTGEAIHHRCARKTCIRPEHMAAASTLENTAEMLARRALVRRIRTLEQALRAFRPDHPALDREPTGYEAAA